MRLVEGHATVSDLGDFLGSLDDVAMDTGCTVQAFDARYVADRKHLERAVKLADRARERGETIARDRGIEILLYAAGRRQIDEALDMGLSEGELPVVLLVDHPDGSDAAESDAVEQLRVLVGFDPMETVTCGNTSQLREFFDISDTELAATEGTLADIIHERVVFLDMDK